MACSETGCSQASFMLTSIRCCWPNVYTCAISRVAELDSINPKLMTDSRIYRIARGSGRSLREVHEMLEEFKRLAKIWSKMKGLKIPQKGDMSAMSRNMNAQHMSKVLPPQMLKQIGGIGGLQSLMKQMNSKEFSGMFGGGDGPDMK